jgi:hypothetical protein
MKLKTLNRINEIKKCLDAYQESIELLEGYANGSIPCGYKRTNDDNRRMQFTLKNIKNRMQLLAHELTVLQEYGA